LQAELARDNGLISCTVTIDADTVTAAYDRAYAEFGANIKVPGFRRGHAPKNIIRARVNQEELRRTMLSEIVPAAAREVMAKYGLEALEGPTLETYHLREGDPLVFRFSLVERPRVSVADYAELDPDGAPEEEVPDVEQALENMRQQQAQMEDSAEPAGETDVVEGELEFRRVDGNWLIDESARIDLGSERVEGDIRKGLLGIKAGEERSFEVKDEEGQKRGDCRFKAVRVAQKVVPELDDEFARTVGRVKSLEELKARLVEQLQQQADREQEQRRRQALLEQLVAKSRIEVPVYSTVKLAAGIVGDLVDSLRSRGLSLESLRGEGANTAEQVFQQALESAQRRIKEQLVVEEVAKRENIEVEMPAAAEDEEAEERRRAALVRERVMEVLVERAQRPEQAGAEAGQEQAEKEGESDADGS
jgi:trigger factor